MRCKTGFVTGTWEQSEKVDEYVERIGTVAPRLAGEAELIEAMPAEVRSLLDLGCGDGDMASRFERLGARVTGLDADPRMLTATVA